MLHDEVAAFQKQLAGPCASYPKPRGEAVLLHVVVLLHVDSYCGDAVRSAVAPLDCCCRVLFLHSNEAEGQLLEEVVAHDVNIPMNGADEKDGSSQGGNFLDASIDCCAVVADDDVPMEPPTCR